jgi:hypothetical protein
MKLSKEEKELFANMTQEELAAILKKTEPTPEEQSAGNQAAMLLAILFGFLLWVGFWPGARSSVDWNCANFFVLIYIASLLFKIAHPLK